MTITRTLAATLLAALTAGTATAAAAPAPRPVPGATVPVGKAATTTGFRTVRTTSFTAQSVTSPATGTAVVVGVKAQPGTAGPIMVETFGPRGWTTRTLPGSATQARVASGAGTIWILGIGATPTLWRSQGTHHVRVAVPLPPGAASFTPYAVAAEGRTVVLWGATTSAGSRPGSGALARFDGKAWTFQQDSFGPTTFYGPSDRTGRTLLELVDGHALAGTGFMGQVHVWGTLYDYATTPPTDLGWLEVHAPDGGGYRAEDLTARSPQDVTAWGASTDLDPQNHDLYRTRGLCIRVTPGQRDWCAAPTYAVAAADRLADGRQVLGGKDTFTTYDRMTQARTDLVQGGYAVVTAPGGTPQALPGDPGDAVVDLAAEPRGTAVWSVVRNGDRTAVQRAFLAAGIVAKTPATTTGAGAGHR
ncbi:hypothetical protein [Arsenicicoccus dermatophilus]|uniref:hypothetical protein n=1 Tax=Arsenicicoccus dermatophilus TaxID=1076331 RepID=UPI001F4CC6B6|nr:hypothetical protein [Arsenicicoccus dermatophilus]MCH8614244.1 hypothetical protein [Arsenicicoccus dermatophilus]